RRKTGGCRKPTRPVTEETITLMRRQPDRSFDFSKYSIREIHAHLPLRKTDPTEAKNRIDELRAADITAIQFRGSTHIDGIPLLGKGCVGVVVTAMLD